MAKKKDNNNEEPLEKQLWKSADKLRKNIDAAEYKAENVFFVPAEARWNFLLSKAKQPTIDKSVDGAMDSIEKENTSLKGVLPKVYARQNLDPTSLAKGSLTPGRYLGLADNEEAFDFIERFSSLKAEFEAQLKEEANLNKAILENLKKVKLG